MSALEWLARVRHDLVKRLVWPARDRRDIGGERRRRASWLARPHRRRGAPDDRRGAVGGAGGRRAARGRRWPTFAAALADAVAAAEAGDVPGVSRWSRPSHARGLGPILGR